MSSCVFPGSFDPLTKGHMDLIIRASRLFDRVTVTMMVNIRKKETIPSDLRFQMLQHACADFGNVRIDRWDGLLTDYMRNHGERIIIRGVRSGLEYETEYISARINRSLCPETETLLIPSDPELACVSSSVVRELAQFGGDIRPYVPENVLEEIRSALSNH